MNCQPLRLLPLVCVTALLLAAGVWHAASSRAWADDKQDGKSTAETTPAPAAAQSTSPAPTNSKFKAFSEVTKEAEHLPGLIDLYREGKHLYAALKPELFEQPFLAPISVAEGAGAAGMAFNFDEQWIVAFRRVGDQVQLVRKNNRYQADDGSPLTKAVRRGYIDSTLQTLEIVSDDAPGGAVLVDLGEVFLGNFANLPTGTIDKNRSQWRSVKAFPDNIELRVEATFDGSPVPTGMGTNGDLGYVDPRAVTIVLHYSLVRMPAEGYRPRRADPRIGHFVSAVKNFDSTDPDGLFTRRITRWRLEKDDPEAAMSPPKKQIVWWIEDTVPPKYRPFVEDGILEWNKAFEKIGFRKALAVRWQTEQDEFDAEDVNYCVFRWITSPYGYAMSNLRSNPVTGEIVDGDILFDSSWIRYWQHRNAYLAGVPANGDAAQAIIIDEGTIVSPIMAAQYGYGLPSAVRRQLFGQRTSAFLTDGKQIDVLPTTWNPTYEALAQRTTSAGCCACQYASLLQNQLRLGAVALADSAAGSPLEKGELSDEVLGQVIKNVVMHEVGHSLGLKHNFRGSNSCQNQDLHDARHTREHGLSSSVMDYAPLNLALRGEQQGDFAPTTLGPYDYWAIEYAYKPIAAEEEAEELKRIASRSAEPQLAYASDEDYFAAYDPLVNQYDLGADPLEYARHQIALAKDALGRIDETLVRDGQSWNRLRPAVMTLLQQYGDAAFLAVRFLGGRQVTHDAKATPAARDPIVPVSGDQQRKALQFLVEYILVEDPVALRPELLRRLTTEQWTHWGADTRVYEGKVGLPYYAHIQSIQEIAFAETLGSGTRLRLIENNEALAGAADEPLRLADVFEMFDQAVWSSTQAALEKSGTFSVSKSLRNLQHMHIRYLTSIVLSERHNQQPATAFALFSGRTQDFPNEACSLARQELKDIDDLLRRTMDRADLEIDAVTRAHLADVADEVTEALKAQLVMQRDK